MTEQEEKIDIVENTAPAKENKDSYISDQIISILFPIVALWYGPKYLMK